jgi:hypothetical protein
LLDNQNPTPGVQNDFRSRDNSLAAFWTPNGSKRISVMAEYNRSTLHSRIDYLLSPFFTPSVSIYNDNAHTATSTIDIAFPDCEGRAAKLTAGGSLFVSRVRARRTISRWEGFPFRFEKPTMEHRLALLRVPRNVLQLRMVPGAHGYHLAQSEHIGDQPFPCFES